MERRVHMTRMLLTVAFDCIESHIESRLSCAISLADPLHCALDASPLARDDNLDTHKPWPNPPRHQHRQQIRRLRLPAPHHLNRGLQGLQHRSPPRSHLQCHPNRQMLLPRLSPPLPPRIYQFRAQHRLHNLHPPQTAIVPPAPATAPVQVSRKTEWTTVAVALITVVLTAAALAAAYVIIPFALESQRHDFHERCLADHDHNLPMAKGYPKELDGPRLSFVKRQIETAHVVRFAAAQGIQFAKMRLEGFPDLRIVWHGTISMVVTFLAWHSIKFLVSITKPDLLYSIEAVVCLLLVVPLALFLTVLVRFVVNDARNRGEISNT
jgi:hypothetical protein